MTKQVISRDEAKKLGRIRFFTGSACRHGHFAERLVSDGKCITCVRLRFIGWRERNRQKIATYKKRWRADNPDALRKWHAANPEKAPQYKRTEYSKDKEKIKARVKRHSALNPDMPRTWSRNKRARKKLADGTHTAKDVAEIRRLQKDRCAMPYCKKKLNGGGHVDHIIPLAKGGPNSRRNLQLLCGPCNMQKRAKDPLVFARERGMLL